MTLIGLDMNATRARAVAGLRSQALSLLRLEGDQVELPVALSLEEKHPPQSADRGWPSRRLRPHLACLDFLPHVGAGRIWSAGAHRLDADRALSLVFEALARPLARASGVVLALPGYLDEAQLGRMHALATAARLPLLGSVAAPLAAALAAHEQEAGGWPPAHGPILVVDVDGHALTWSVVEREPAGLHLRLCQSAAHLGRGQWLRKLLDGVAHRCVRQSRRDPRESADIEQALYEQIAFALDGAPTGGMVQMRIQGRQWYHHMMFAPDELAAFVSPLLKQTTADLESVLAAVQTIGGLAGAVVTAAAASLPGLAPALQARLETMIHVAPVDDEADYGDHLLSAMNKREPVRRSCGLDAVAGAAHELAVRIHRGDLRPGHLESIPLTAGAAALPNDPGPARLTFRGEDHVLSGTLFSLGRDPGCDLVFESELYPHVSARHCEIVYDRRSYMLCDRSRYGTLLNDRKIEQASLHSGDWIRLGPHGPVLRFLDQTEKVGSR